MMMEEGVVLGHFISSKDIQVDPTMIKVISTLLTLEKQKDVQSFLVHSGYYRIFIKTSTNLWNLSTTYSERTLNLFGILTM